jgi:hypothetical protein
MGHEKAYVKLKVYNCISYLFLYSVYLERKILTGVSTKRPSFPLSSQYRCSQRAPRHSPSGHAVFASPVPCRTVAELLQASGRLFYFHPTQPQNKQAREKAWGILRLYKKKVCIYETYREREGNFLQRTHKGMGSYVKFSVLATATS